MASFKQFKQQTPPQHWPAARKAAWQQVLESSQHLAPLQTLVDNTDRNGQLKMVAAGISLDLSRNWIDTTVLAALGDLLKESDFTAQRRALFTGQHVNNTEDRPALHTALRNKAHQNDTPGDYCQVVQACIERMRTLATAVRNGTWQSSTGQAITDVVNIGIGGSDLGPRMVTRALTPHQQNGPKVHFVANADPADLGSLLPTLNPQTTLFIICSKSFQTQETKLNALSARAWLNAGLDQPDLSRHFIGVTTNEAAAVEFGLDRENLLPLWDWVGGRYSVWSAIGLSVMIAIGPDQFDAFLNGAAAMDTHFYQTAPLEGNAPVMMAFLSFLYGNSFGAQSQAIVPYATLLEHFPSYLQQLIMESNGKGCHRNGETTSLSTSPIIWGYIGTNSQHSFHQLLHQGTQLVPVDFILCESGPYGTRQDHYPLQAHCLAQMQALLQGRKVSPVPGDNHEQAQLVAKHRTMHGNRPSSLITLPSLDPFHLGALIALYEHKTFVEACLWDINAYDQWGVELGKVFSQQIENDLNAEKINTATLDQATVDSLNALIEAHRKAK